MSRAAHADPTECNSTLTSVYLSGLSAFRAADNRDIRLAFLYPENLYVDYMYISCTEVCQENPDCFAYEVTADGEYESTP